MKLFQRLLFLSTACFLFTVMLTGCSTTSNSRIEPQAILKFTDVPVPVGLKSLPKASYSFESSGVRVGVLRYQGKNNPEQLVNFYKEQMSMYNWNLVNIVEYGQRLMNFERENESCIINLEPKGSSIILTISLGPKSQNLGKRTRLPIK